MTWFAIIGLAWVLLALSLAVVMGRGIRQADERQRLALWASEVDDFVRASTERRLLVTAAPAPRHPSD